MMTININGNPYDSLEEACKTMFQEAATNPDCTNLVWAYQDYTGCVFVGGGVKLYIQMEPMARESVPTRAESMRESSNTKAISCM